MQSTRLIRQIPTPSEMDTVKARQKRIGKERDLHLIELCRELWENNDRFRRQRARAFRFTYVDQLSDLMEVNGETMTMRQYLTRTGNVALQTNQMKNKVETMEGVIVKESLEPVCFARDRKEQQYGELLTNALQANCNKNKMTKLYISWVKEACLGGLMAAYETWDATSGPAGTLDSWTQYINPNMLFFDANMDDPRFWDMTIVGRIKKYDFGKICANFAHNEKDYGILRDIYPEQATMFKNKRYSDPTDRFDERLTSFMTDPDPSVCCVCEVWTKETKGRIRLHDLNQGTEEIIDADDFAYRKLIKKENEARRLLGKQQGWDDSEIPYITGDGYGEDEITKNGFFVDEYWYCRDLAPDGTILWEGESPYADRSHPFTVAAIPMIDGQIVGYLYDMIDHNIIMNRAICLNDWLIRTNAKGVVVVPKQLVPQNMSEQEFANSWTSIDDMVFIDVKPGYEHVVPQVFYGQAQTFNVAQYLDTFSRMGDKATAITDAIQGKTPHSGTSGSMYAQMAEHSTTAISSFLSSVHSFLEDIHTKKVKNIAAFYDIERFAKIESNMDGLFDESAINLNEISNIEYDISIKESTETPVYRMVMAQDAKEFLMAGLIDFETYLDISAVPYADKLKQKIQARKAEADAEEASAVPGQQNTAVAP